MDSHGQRLRGLSGHSDIGRVLQSVLGGPVGVLEKVSIYAADTREFMEVAVKSTSCEVGLDCQNLSFGLSLADRIRTNFFRNGAWSWAFFEMAAPRTPENVAVMCGAATGSHPPAVRPVP